MSHSSSWRGEAQPEQRHYRERGTGWAGADAGDRKLEQGPAAFTRAAAGLQPASGHYEGEPYGPEPPDGAAGGASLGEGGEAVPKAQPLHASHLAVAGEGDRPGAGVHACDARPPMGAEPSVSTPAVSDGARDDGSGRARDNTEVPPDEGEVQPDEARRPPDAPGGAASCGGKGGSSAGQPEQEGAFCASGAAAASLGERRWTAPPPPP